MTTGFCVLKNYNFYILFVIFFLVRWFVGTHNYQDEIPNKIRWQIAAAELRRRELPGEKNRKERRKLARMIKSKGRLLEQVIKAKGTEES